jgi:hypothetical protein
MIRSCRRWTGCRRGSTRLKRNPGPALLDKPAVPPAEVFSAMAVSRHQQGRHLFQYSLRDLFFAFLYVSFLTSYHVARNRLWPHARGDVAFYIVGLALCVLALRDVGHVHRARRSLAFLMLGVILCAISTVFGLFRSFEAIGGLRADRVRFCVLHSIGAGMVLPAVCSATALLFACRQLGLTREVRETIVLNVIIVIDVALLGAFIYCAFSCESACGHPFNRLLIPGRWHCWLVQQCGNG